MSDERRQQSIADAHAEYAAQREARRHSEQRLIEELGKNQTVKDVQAALLALREGKRQRAVQLRHARQDREKVQAEIETFLDDLQQISGLSLNDPQFLAVALMTIQRRLQRRNLAKSDMVQDSFPNGW